MTPLTKALLSKCEFIDWRGERENARLMPLILALAECVEALELCKPGGSQARSDLALEVKKIGGLYGFGALMSEASHQWQSSLVDAGYGNGGAFTVGPCVTTVSKALERLKGLVGDAQQGETK